MEAKTNLENESLMNILESLNLDSSEVITVFNIV